MKFEAGNPQLNDRKLTKNQTTECGMKLIDELASQAKKECC